MLFTAYHPLIPSLSPHYPLTTLPTPHHLPQEPDPQLNITHTIEGRQVTVPQGPPTPVTQYATSRFDQSEYLIYRESQHRIRYVLTVEM